MKIRKEHGKIIMTIENGDPNSICDLGEKMNGSMLDVEEFEVKENSKYVCNDGLLYSKDMKILFMVPPGKKGVVEIPDSVKVIMPKAFSLSAVQKVVVPGSVVCIESYTFHICPYLKEVILNEGIKSISSWSFWCCDSLHDITIPGSVCNVGGDFLQETPIKNLRFAESDEILVMEGNAFSSCSAKYIEFSNRPVSFSTLDFWDAMEARLPYTEIGLSEVPQLLNSVVRNSEAADASRIHEFMDQRYGAFKLMIGDETLYFPKVMSIKNRKHLVGQASIICFGIVASFTKRLKMLKRRSKNGSDVGNYKDIDDRIEKLKKLSYDMCFNGIADAASDVAVNIYADMLKSGKDCEEKRIIANYLKFDVIRIIPILAVAYRDVEGLKKVLDFGLASEDVLRYCLEEVEKQSDKFEDGLAIEKAYLLEAIRNVECECNGCEEKDVFKV